MGTVTKGRIMKAKIIFCMIVLLSAFAFADGVESVRKTIKELEIERQSAAIAGDYDKALTFFTDDVVIMQAMDEPITGKKSLARSYREQKQKGVRFHSISSTILADWLCGENYYERGTWSMSVSSRDNPRPVAFLGSYFQIWEKQKDGSFKIKLNIYNFDHPL
jgi:ketosteroid isomerase-like protein